jgi:hypothetical protein
LRRPFSKRSADRLTLLVDADWTRWSSGSSQITLNFGNPVQPVQSLCSTGTIASVSALGGIYHFDDSNSDLRAGFSYDQSAVSDAFRSADLADSDAMMYLGGLMHRFDDRFSMTVSYSYGHHARRHPVNLLMPEPGSWLECFTVAPMPSVWTCVSGCRLRIWRRASSLLQEPVRTDRVSVRIVRTG